MREHRETDLFNCTKKLNYLPFHALVLKEQHTKVKLAWLECRICWRVFVQCIFQHVLVLLFGFFHQKETPLANAAFWAARKGNLALLQLLLNSGRVDVDCKDSVCTQCTYTHGTGFTSLSIACCTEGVAGI